jgi:hypothetical protein
VTVLLVIFTVWALVTLGYLLGWWERGRMECNAQLLSYRPGDIVVFQTDRRVPRDVFERLREQLRQQLRDEEARILVLEAGLKFETIVETHDRS